MEKFNLKDMTKGWFIGNFEPTVLKTNDVEVSIKKYIKGDHEGKHFHEIATEITAVVFGKIKMFDTVFVENDIIVIKPGEATSFEALEDTLTVVIKHPGVNDDKYLI